MNRIKNLWNSGTVGKITIGSLGLSLFCCLCSIPINILNPSTPTPTQEQIVAPTEAIQPTETTAPTETPVPSKVDLYLNEFGGNRDVYLSILALTTCNELQEQFNTASENNKREMAGTEGYQWTLGYMTAADCQVRPCVKSWINAASRLNFQAYYLA